MKKIISNTPGKGRLINPFASSSLDAYGLFEQNNPEIDAFYSDGITRVHLGQYEADKAWQYKDKFGRWLGVDKGQFLESDVETRHVFIATIPAPDAQPVKAVEEEMKPPSDYKGAYETHVYANKIRETLGHNNGILPCPHCGGKEGKDVILGYDYPNYRIACVPCAVVMHHDRKDKVIGMWNGRTHLKQTHVPVEEVVKIIERSCGSDGKIHWPKQLLEQINLLTKK